MFRLLPLALFCVFVSACQLPASQAPENGEEKLVDHQARKSRKEKRQEAENAHDHTHTPALSLNNGERWTANPETSAAVEVLDKHLDIFLLNDQHTLDEYRALGEQMMNDYNDIFAVCTMTGEAHVQLHNFLVPIGSMIEVLKTGNAEECHAVLEPLHRQLHSYAVYFH